MIERDCIEALIAKHRNVAAAVVTQAKGSSPRDAGAMMLIHPDGTLGTIGGGTVEHQTIERARHLLQASGPPEEHAFPLGPDLDQCCGGHMKVAIGLVALTGAETSLPDATSPLPPCGAGMGREAVRLWPEGPLLPEQHPNRPVFLYGAGHVGQALMRALVPLPFQVTLVDSRPGAHLNGEPHIITPLPEAVVQDATPDAFHLVLTHSHAVDLEIVSAILSRSFGFCGLIGSATKRKVFERRLAERGFMPEVLQHLICPIGEPMLRDKRPEVIAASVAMQLLLRDEVLRERS